MQPTHGAASPPPPLTCARLPACQDGVTSLIFSSHNGHVEAVRLLIEKGANLEAASNVRIYSHATTHARSKTLMHTHMHTLAWERTI
jgi:hypothetical protein